MPLTWDELQKRHPPPGGRKIESCGDRRWRVILPIGKDPITGKKLIHHKAVRGSKADAQRYVDWITKMVAAGQAVTTVSQSQLRELQALQAKADKLRAQLQAEVRDGAIVQPGALELPVPAAGALLPEKRRPRTAVDPATRTRNRELLRPLFR
jgi:hypothetical protein